MCHLTWKIIGFIRSQAVPVYIYVVHVLFVLIYYVKTCVVPLVYTLAWITRQPVFGHST